MVLCMLCRINGGRITLSNLFWEDGSPNINALENIMIKIKPKNRTKILLPLAIMSTFVDDILHVFLYAFEFDVSVNRQYLSIKDQCFVVEQCTPVSKQLLLEGIVALFHSRLISHGSASISKGTLLIQLHKKAKKVSSDAAIFSFWNMSELFKVFVRPNSFHSIVVDADNLWNLDFRYMLFKQVVVSALLAVDGVNVFTPGTDVPERFAITKNGTQSRNPASVVWDWRYSKLRKHVLLGTSMDTRPYRTVLAPFQSFLDLVALGDEVSVSWFMSTQLLATTANTMWFEVVHVIPAHMVAQLCTLIRTFVVGMDTVFVAVFDNFHKGTNIVVCETEELVAEETKAESNDQLQCTHTWSPGTDAEFLHTLVVSLRKVSVCAIRTTDSFSDGLLAALLTEVFLPLLSCTTTSFTLQVEDVSFLLRVCEGAAPVDIMELVHEPALVASPAKRRCPFKDRRLHDLSMLSFPLSCLSKSLL